MRALAAVAAALLLPACSPGGGGGGGGAIAAASKVVPVRVAGPGHSHVFLVEQAQTPAAQERGLMYRTDLKPDSGMLFWPYPAAGGEPKVANFWMKNTPTPLDIVFIRADGTVARVAENAIPQSEELVGSGEPVAAVLELVGGRAAETGVAAGDRVSWPGR